WLVARHSLDQMKELIPVPAASELHRGKPGYGLGLMGSAASPGGWTGGHNGGGPCYSASAFHSIDLGASVCVMAAIENFTANAENAVFGMLDHLKGDDSPRF